MTTLHSQQDNNNGTCPPKLISLQPEDTETDVVAAIVVHPMWCSCDGGQYLGQRDLNKRFIGLSAQQSYLSIRQLLLRFLPLPTSCFPPEQQWNSPFHLRLLQWKATCR